jgi:hypothetical protein
MFIGKFKRVKQLESGWGRTSSILEHFYKNMTSLRSKDTQLLAKQKVHT